MVRDSELAWWGPLATDATLARVNEPRQRARANLVALEPPEAPGADRLLFCVARPVAEGEELLIAYGGNYDRSGYGDA